MAEEKGKIDQVEVDYGGVMDFEVLNGAQVVRRTITDTYSAPEGESEENMVKELSKMIDYLFTKREGFCGYLSWCYALMTLCFLLGEYDKALLMLENIEVCSEDIKRFIFTGNYSNADGTPTGFKNYSYGESADESVNTLKFAKDSYQAAMLIHRRAQSFESGFSFVVTSLLYHLVISDSGSATKDCECLDSLVLQIRGYIKEVKENPEKSVIDESAETFTDISKLIEKGA